MSLDYGEESGSITGGNYSSITPSAGLMLMSTIPNSHVCRVSSRKNFLGEKWAWQFHTP